MPDEPAQAQFRGAEFTHAHKQHRTCICDLDRFPLFPPMLAAVGRTASRLILRRFIGSSYLNQMHMRACAKTRVLTYYVPALKHVLQVNISFCVELHLARESLGDFQECQIGIFRGIWSCSTTAPS